MGHGRQTRQASRRAGCGARTGRVAAAPRRRAPTARDCNAAAPRTAAPPRPRYFLPQWPLLPQSFGTLAPRAAAGSHAGASRQRRPTAGPAPPASAAAPHCTTRAPRACGTSGRVQARRRGAARGTAPPRRATAAAAPWPRWPWPPPVPAQPRAAVPRRCAAPRAAPAPGTFKGCGGAVRVARRWWRAPAAARAPPSFFRQRRLWQAGRSGRWSGPCAAAAARNRRRAVPLLGAYAVATSGVVRRRRGSSGSRRDLATALPLFIVH